MLNVTIQDMTEFVEENIHRKLSDLNDEAGNIYEMTRDIAAVAKQIKEETKEEIDPPNPVIEAIEKMFAMELNSTSSLAA